MAASDFEIAADGPTAGDVSGGSSWITSWRILAVEVVGTLTAFVGDQEREEWFHVYAVVAFLLSLVALSSTAVVVYLLYQALKGQPSSDAPVLRGSSNSSGVEMAEVVVQDVPVKKTCANRRKMDPHLHSQAYPPSAQYESNFPRLFFIPQRSKVIGMVLFALFVLCCVTVAKEPLTAIGLPPNEVLRYLSLPVVCVAFTYGHIWLALWMTFYPIDFVGVPGTQVEGMPFGLGWQGIIPSKARKVGERSTRNFQEKVLPIEDLFARVDPEGLHQVLQEPIFKEIKDILNELGTTEAPEVWRLMPERVKEELAVKLTEDLPNSVNALFNRIKTNITSFFDMEEFCVEATLRNKALFVFTFVEQGKPELEFIRDCGGYMGLIFGLIQMFQQYLFPANWLLPAYAGGLGLLSNWIALKMNFWPLEPWPLLGGRLVLHGAFMRRQEVFAPQYARDFATTFGCARALIPAITIGSGSEFLCATIQEELDKGIDRSAESIQPIIRAAGCEDNYARFKKAAIDKVSDSMPEILMHAQEYIDKSMDIEKLLTDRIRELSPRDFEEMLHPNFQDDEWLLIVVGGILGLVVGFLQMIFIGT